MVDVNRAWRASGLDGTLVTSEHFGSEGHKIHARCADAETAEHIVRLHNEARGDGARMVRVAQGSKLTLRRPGFGEPPVCLPFNPLDLPSSIQLDDGTKILASATGDPSSVRDSPIA